MKKEFFEIKVIREAGSGGHREKIGTVESVPEIMITRVSHSNSNHVVR